MKLLGKIENADQAQRFGDFLLSIGIENQVDEGRSAWEIWVLDVDQMPRAKEELEAYLADPNAATYLESMKKAKSIEKQKKKEQVERDKLYVDVRTQNRGATGGKQAVWMLIGVSVVIFLMHHVIRSEASFKILSLLPIDEYVIPPYLFHEVLGGEVWRLFTPIFIHGDIFHVAFNMLWLNFLGGLVETRKGQMKFWALVLFVAAVSNSAQYILSGPAFGGMSGVNYGLLGYIWMKMKFEPHEQIKMDPFFVKLMLLWMVLCMVGLIGNVANTCHVVGLLSGMAVGYNPTFWRRLKKGKKLI